ncbi:MAG: ribonuclease HI [Clostridia bacterium]
MKNIILYTDGACSGNPGVGGWAAILIFNGREKELSGYLPETTNNRMEMFAVIQGLRALKEPCEVTIYTDSAYVSDAFNKHWIESWIKKDWKTADNSDVKNQDLWKALIYETNKNSVKFVRVKGHSDDKLNNRCDDMAVAAIKTYKEKNEVKNKENSDLVV